MKLNHLFGLGTTSLLVALVPLSSYAENYFHNSSQLTAPIIAKAQTVALMEGTFVAGEKPTTGTAQIVTEGGHRYLELNSAFSTSNQGPDLHVLLDTETKPSQSYQNVNRTVNLGKLNNYTGSQRYPIPDGINLSQYKSVVIWCRMANATFGYAPLRAINNAQK